MRQEIYYPPCPGILRRPDIIGTPQNDIWDKARPDEPILPVSLEYGQTEDIDIAKNIVKYASNIGAEMIYISLHKDMTQEFLSDLQEKKRDSSLTCCTRMIFGDAIKENTKKVYASFIAATG